MEIDIEVPGRQLEVADIHRSVSRTERSQMASSKDQHAHIYIQRNEGPRKRKRIVPMEVLSLGFSRIGTMAMKTALEILDIPTWHCITQAENPPDLTMWTQALRAKWEPETSNLQPYRSE